MASKSEYEQQQFWEDKPIEVILGDNSNWEFKPWTNDDLKRHNIFKTYTDINIDYKII